MKNSVVLDASVVLAYLQNEVGTNKIEKILTEEEAIISSVNFAEVVSKLTDIGMPESEIRLVLENLELTIVAVNEEQAWLLGLLRNKTKKYGLSLGDRACIALAESLNYPVYTTDKQWSKIVSHIAIIQLR